MKIGVITFWQSEDNYGQLLQAWALQQFLKKKGHDAYIIRYDFIGNIQNVPFWKKCVKSSILYLLYRKLLHVFISDSHRILDEKREFDLFRNQHLSVSSRRYRSLSALQKHAPEADCYIVGSDQVWAQLLSYKENQAFFLNFGDSDVRRISYAPSFSMEDYPSDLKQLLREQLQRFDHVSVREESGVDICSSVGVSAVRVVDPTLLLDKNDYLSLLTTELDERSFIFIYSLNITSPDELYWRDLKQFAKNLNLDFIVTTASGYIRGRELFEDVQYKYATIPEWLSYIYYAKLVVTSSFHGVVLSILMHTPFVYVPLKGKFSGGNGRVLDILKDLALESRVLSEGQSYQQIFNLLIDWDNVDKLLYQLKYKSLSFVEKALS